MPDGSFPSLSVVLSCTHAGEPFLPKSFPEHHRTQKSPLSLCRSGLFELPRTVPVNDMNNLPASLLAFRQGWQCQVNTISVHPELATELAIDLHSVQAVPLTSHQTECLFNSLTKICTVVDGLSFEGECFA